MNKNKNVSFSTLLVYLFLAVNCGATVQDSLVDTTARDVFVFKGFEAVNSGQIIHFSWVVQSEFNGDHFLVEKSIDSCKTWKNVGSVSSIGNHSELHTYELSEISIVQSVQECFRLSRYDKYGESEKLDSIFILHPTLSKLKLISDPKKPKEGVTISCESLIDIEATLTIFDWEGNVVYEKPMPLTEGYNRKQVMTKGMAPGDYRVVVRNAQDASTAKRLVIYEP